MRNRAILLAFLAVAIFGTFYAYLGSKANSKSLNFNSTESTESTGATRDERTTNEIQFQHVSRIVEEGDSKKLYNRVELLRGSSDIKIRSIVFFGEREIPSLSRNLTFKESKVKEAALDLKDFSWKGETVTVVYLFQPYVPSEIESKSPGTLYYPSGGSFYDEDTIPGENKQQYFMPTYKLVEREGTSYLRKGSQKANIYQGGAGEFFVYFNPENEQKRDYYLTCLNNGEQVKINGENYAMKLPYAKGKAYLVGPFRLSDAAKGRLQCITLNLFNKGSGETVDEYIHAIESVFLK